MSRALLLGLSLSCLLGFALLCAIVAADHKQAQQRKLGENLVRAGLSPEDAPSEPLPAAGTIEIDHTDYDFGATSLQAKVAHVFTIRNVGTGELRLKIQERSCTCILGELKDDVLQPGETTEMELTADSQGIERRVVQGVTLETSDPERPSVALRLIGHFRREVWSDRSTIHFQGLLPGEERTIDVPVYSEWPEGFSVEKSESRPADIRMSVLPLDAAALNAAQAASGVLLKITCPAGVKDFLGGNLTCQLRRNGSSQEETYSFGIEGDRLGLIGVFGPDIDELGRIQLGNIDQFKGKTVSLTIKARGQARQLPATGIRTSPDFVQAELQPLDKVAERGLHRLVITIPPHAPQASFQGEDAGRIEIEFAQEYPSLSLKLEFAVVSDALSLRSTR